MLWLVQYLLLLALLALFALLVYKASTSTVSPRTREAPLPPISSSSKSYAAGETSILCITWNTADTLPTSAELAALLPPADASRHQLISVALQEAPAEGWLNALIAHLGAGFTLIGSASSRGSIHLAVFAQSAAFSDVANIQTGSETFGVPVFFRKGAAGVCLSYRSLRLLFMSAHMTAHEGQVDARNTDALALFFRLGVSCTPSDAHFPLAKRFDAAFLQGDLNYRVIGRSADVIAQLGSATPGAPITSLLECDELTAELRRPQGTYRGWAEQPITFPPTFKLRAKSSESDPSTPLTAASPYDGRRTPSWCDRVLYTGIARGVQYRAGDHGRSDHMPVCASFAL